MRIPFRQGLVSVPATTFLQLTANHVNIILGPADTIVMAFADGDSDYLVTQRQSLPSAWGGPFVSGTDYWLYADLNVKNAALTYGFTLYDSKDGPTPPPNPPIDQHWFDTTSKTMKVWNGLRWIRKVRVLVAQLYQGASFISVSANAPAYTGTQAGLNVEISAGAITYDGNGFPLKKGDDTFFTTEDIAVTGIASSSRVKLGSILIEAVVTGPITPYTIVRFTDFNQVSAATNNVVNIGAYGIVEVAANTGNFVDVTMEGLVTNSDWDWTLAGVNAPLYVDAFGQLTATIPPIPKVIAIVVDKKSVLLLPSSLFVGTSNSGPASTTILGSVKLSVPSVAPLSPVVVGDNDPRVTNVLHTTGGTMTGTLTLSADPTTNLQAATKQYVDSIAQGLNIKPSALVATTMALPTYVYNNGIAGVGATLTAASTGVLTIDGTQIILNDYVLVKDETLTNTPYNGLYKCTVAGAIGIAYELTRAVEMDVGTEFNGSFVFVETGLVNASSGWVCSVNGTITVGTTYITFAQFSGAGQIVAGVGLSKTGNTLDNTGVLSFNTRTGVVTLTLSDVTTALGFTPYDATNPSGYISGISSGDVTTALGFTPEDVANKSTSTGLGTSDTLYPSQNAVKSYVDAQVIAAAGSVSKILKQNNDTVTLTKGTPIYSSGTGMIARAHSDITVPPIGVGIEVIGLVADTSIIPTASGNVQTNDILQATTIDWDAVTGQVGGLTEGAVYYLQTNPPGKLTTVVPSVTGQYVVVVGNALSSTHMSINTQHPLKL